MSLIRFRTSWPHLPQMRPFLFCGVEVNSRAADRSIHCGLTGTDFSSEPYHEEVRRVGSCFFEGAGA